VRVVAFGGRDFGNPKAKGKKIEEARHEYRFVFGILDTVHEIYGITKMIVGRATGADSVAEDWAKKRGVPVEPYPARWDDIDRPGAVVKTTRGGKKYDAAAGGVRNQRMINEGKPDIAIGFPGGSGTADMIDRCKSARIQTWKVSPNENVPDLSEGVAGNRVSEKERYRKVA